MFTRQHDPVTAAAKLSVIGQILASQDVTAAVWDVLSAPRPASRRDFGHRLPSYLRRASPQLHDLLGQALNFPVTFEQGPEPATDDSDSHRQQ